jgi:pyruvate dehydrogenase E1 component alpha subunit
MQTASHDFAAKARRTVSRRQGGRHDALAVYDAVTTPSQGRQGGGPTLIEAVTMRMHGHAEHDPADYVPREMFEEWRKKGSRRTVRAAAVGRRCAHRRSAKETREKARQHAIDARRKALADPMPDGSTVEEGVYAD